MKNSLAMALLVCVCATAGCASHDGPTGDGDDTAATMSWQDAPVLSQRGFDGFEVGADFAAVKDEAVSHETIEDMSTDFCQQFGDPRSWAVLSDDGKRVDAVQALADVETNFGVGLGMRRDLVRENYPKSTQRFRPGMEFFEQDITGATTVQAFIEDDRVASLWVVADEKAPVPEELCALPTHTAGEQMPNGDDQGESDTEEPTEATPDLGNIEIDDIDDDTAEPSDISTGESDASTQGEPDSTSATHTPQATDSGQATPSTSVHGPSVDGTNPEASGTDGADASPREPVEPGELATTGDPVQPSGTNAETTSPTSVPEHDEEPTVEEIELRNPTPAKEATNGNEGSDAPAAPERPAVESSDAEQYDRTRSDG